MEKSFLTSWLSIKRLLHFSIHSTRSLLCFLHGTMLLEHYGASTAVEISILSFNITHVEVNLCYLYT